MEAEFWHKRWQKNEIGFHQEGGNSALRAAFGRLALGDGSSVFVPLCGKSIDMAWLHERGCNVIGVELSATAVQGFLAEQGVQAERREIGDGLWCYTAERYVLYQGDFFLLTSSHLGSLDAVCDRAALVALPAAMRRSYATRLMELAGSAPIVLISLDYAQYEMSGPPFAVPDAEVQALFGAGRQVERLAAREVLGEESGLRQRGLSSLRETAWLIRPLV